ncbi:hypothetical protein STRAU_5648 [Streptomyces aurantiacus JA 4570]|uniref:Uncharacterized protein n=1 Tax=Streptomyces aurantiacus JA 4570 TaxID=1286094 RepID=S3ZS92_9ACTN|nr:hypothetical protein STRAU_5648 [Streptomyces aurantiacus JA 4570]
MRRNLSLARAPFMGLRPSPPFRPSGPPGLVLKRRTG